MVGPPANFQWHDPGIKSIALATKTVQRSGRREPTTPEPHRTRWKTRPKDPVRSRLFYKQGQRIKTRTQPSKQRQISKIERILLRIWSHFQQDSSRAIATKEPVAWPHSFEEAKTLLGKSLEFSNMASVCAGYDEMTHLKRIALTPAGKPLGRKHLYNTFLHGLPPLHVLICSPLMPWIQHWIRSSCPLMNLYWPRGLACHWWFRLRTDIAFNKVRRAAHKLEKARDNAPAILMWLEQPV